MKKENKRNNKRIYEKPIIQSQRIIDRRTLACGRCPVGDIVDPTSVSCVSSPYYSG